MIRQKAKEQRRANLALLWFRVTAIQGFFSLANGKLGLRRGPFWGPLWRVPMLRKIHAKPLGGQDPQ